MSGLFFYQINECSEKVELANGTVSKKASKPKKEEKKPEPKAAASKAPPKKASARTKSAGAKVSFNRKLFHFEKKILNVALQIANFV